MRIVQSSFLLVALLWAISIGVIYWIGSRVTSATNDAMAAHALIDKVNKILSDVKDAETGQRGYVITGNAKYLDPYEAAKSEINLDLSGLDPDARGAAINAQDLAALKQFISAKMDELALIVSLRKAQGFSPAAAEVESDRGMHYMDEIRRLISIMVQRQTVKLSEDDRRVYLAGLWRNLVYVLVTLANLTFFAFAYRRVEGAVTERAAAMRELQQQKDLVAVTLASIGDGVIVTDLRGHVTYMNAEAQKLTGWDFDEVAGKPCATVFNIINEESRGRVESPVEKVLKTGVVVGLANHTLLIRKDGSELPIDDSGAPIRGADGSLRGVVLVFRDFTDHKLAEKKLRDALSLLNSVTNSTPDLIFAKDRDARLILANRATLAVIGKSLDEVLGRSEKDWHHDPGEAEAIVQSDLRIMESGKPAVVEERFSTVIGPRIFRSHKSPMIDEQGNTIGIVGVSRDITDQKRAETDLAAAKEAAELANIAKDNFLATLSHELRTPLSPVLATPNLWESTGELPAALVPDAQMIRRNVELEARLIDDLLDLTRIVKGKLPLNMETADSHTLVKSVADMYQSELSGKKLKVAMELEATRHFVHADPARLQQVFWNIFKNAIKFTPVGGSIRIVSRNEADNRIEFSFRDTGIGMEHETLARLFEPFEQGSAETVRRYGGLGLGMAISRSLVEAQGGTIMAESEGPGQGSTFKVILNTTADPRPETAGAGAIPAEAKSLNILLVEDHVDTARAMSRLLRSQGHAVRAAGTVAEALESAKQPFDLLLSDIGLPDGTGVELIRQIRKQYGDKITAIALTGFGMEDDLERCREAGFDSHLTKPVNLQSLERLLQQVIKKS
jgi:two-component system CheB/CheR fusion protein